MTRILDSFSFFSHYLNSKDYITIYDGYTTRDPVVLKFCGGGGNGLPRATSSGPELLIEFVTSPFGTFKSSPLQSRTLNGFQLEVRFADSSVDIGHQVAILHSLHILFSLFRFFPFHIDCGRVRGYSKLFVCKE